MTVLISMYIDFPHKDKMVVRPSYLYDGNSYTGKMASLYWDRALVASRWYMKDSLL